MSHFSFISYRKQLQLQSRFRLTTHIIILSDTKAALFLLYTRTELVSTSAERITIQRTALITTLSSSMTLLIMRFCILTEENMGRIYSLIKQTRAN